MKNKIIIILLSSIVICLIIYIVFLKTNNEDSLINNNGTDTNQTTINKYEYDCHFTKTYRIISKLDYQISDEGSFVVVDTFQGYDPKVVVVPRSTFNNLEINKYYEFTYSLKGIGLINNENDLTAYLIPSLDNKAKGNPTSGTIYIDLNINETEKIGLGQIQQPICAGK